MLTNWMRGLAAAGLGMAMLAGGASAQQGAAPRPDSDRERVVDGDLPGPIDSLKDFQDTGQMVFKMADTNNDNQISQKEAVDAGNLLVGGFFFRADQNGDGTLSRDEAQQARDTLLQQKPFLRVVLKRAQAAQTQQGAPGQGQGQAAGTNPLQGISALLDGNNDRQLQAAELRQAVQTGVQGMYAAADTNRDGQMSPGEINAALIGAAQAAAQASFQAADQDRNGALSQDEFTKSIVEPATFIFSMIDVNGDNQITAQEAQSVQRMLMSRLKMLDVPEPANSPRNLIEQGQYQGNPVPNLGSPNQPGRTAPAPRSAAPAPAVAPVPR